MERESTIGIAGLTGKFHTRAREYLQRVIRTLIMVVKSIPLCYNELGFQITSS
jgi:hypothetical protein